MLDLLSFCLFLHAITRMFALTVGTNNSSMRNKTFMPHTAGCWGGGRLGMIAEALNVGTQDTACRGGVIRERAEAGMADPRAVNNSSVVN